VEPYPVAALAPGTTVEDGIVAAETTAELDPEDDEEEDPSHAASKPAPARAAPTRASALVARRGR
jgi:hypothetical protein